MENTFYLSLKALVLNPTGQCLMLRRSAKSKNHAGYWDLPGGKCEPGEPFETALKREIREETGLEIRLRRVLYTTQAEMAGKNIVHLLFEADSVGIDVRLSDEHDEYQWVPAWKLPTLTVPPQFCASLKDYARRAKDPQPDLAWYRKNLLELGAARSHYERLAAALENVLGRGARELDIHGIVQARAKTFSSLAEKIQRPGKHYSEPLRELTDLCGARVITHTLDQVKAMNAWIKSHFQVFEEDSGDKEAILAASEFGYLSHHFIVSFRPGVFPETVVSKELASSGLKAEIQVRTILQHAWADLSHVLSYKNRFKLPRKWEREFARLAAVLEEADRGFQQIADGLREYASNYGNYMSKEQIQRQIERLSTVIDVNPEDSSVVHEKARLAMANEDWQTVVDILRPLADLPVAPLLRDLGISLCKLRRKQVDHAEFAQGQGYLRRAIELDPTDVDALASLGGTWRAKARATADSAAQKTCLARAKEQYRRAFERDPSDPYPLGNYIELEAADHPDMDIASFFRPALDMATRRCQAQIEVSINIPWAYFDLGKFRLLAGEAERALGYYARGADQSAAAWQVESALSSLDTLSPACARLPGFGFCRQFLDIAGRLRFPAQGSKPTPSAGTPLLEAPVVIVCGFANMPPLAEHRKLLAEALGGFAGTVISGGTASGIPGLVGEAQQANKGIHTVGYSPEKLPDGVVLDTRYLKQRRTSGDRFSLNEPLAYWSDLCDAGIPLNQVRLVAIGGGPITALECQMALAFKVPTAFIDHPASAVNRELRELNWLSHECLTTGIQNAEGLRGFLETARMK